MQEKRLVNLMVVAKSIRGFVKVPREGKRKCQGGNLVGYRMDCSAELLTV